MLAPLVISHHGLKRICWLVLLREIFIMFLNLPPFRTQTSNIFQVFIARSSPETSFECSKFLRIFDRAPNLSIQTLNTSILWPTGASAKLESNHFNRVLENLRNMLNSIIVRRQIYIGIGIDLIQFFCFIKSSRPLIKNS